MALKVDGKSIQKKDTKKKRLEWASEFEKVASWGVLEAATYIEGSQRAEKTCLGVPGPPPTSRKKAYLTINGDKYWML